MPYDPDGFWIADPVDYGDVGVILNPDGTPSGGSGTGGLTGTGGDASIGFDWSKFSGLASKLLGAAATPAGIAALATGLYGAFGGGNKPSGSPGWKGTINPNALTATRTPIAQPAYTPYSGQPVMGRQHFSDVAYTPRTAAGAPVAPSPAPPPTADDPVMHTLPYFPRAAQGGLMSLARGGATKDPRYLQGATDGMADKISTTIDGDQPAALSHGEFVVPADVVSHLGNGNSDAGANVLYRMMDRVRKARTGNEKQGKQINPEKFTPGGIAGYAGGGVVAFAGEGSSLVAGQGTGTSIPVSQESNLSSWAGPGIADYIQRGTALSQTPYQAYTGPLTAGSSPLQQQAFTAAGNLQTPAALGQAAQTAGDVGSRMGALSYSPTQATNQFTGTSPYAASNISTGQFDTAQAQQYMNPYLQASLDPQLAEARRQSQITQMGNAAKATQSGAFGGGRNAIMDAETQRNLGTNLANITGQGYNTAYTNAMGQFNSDQARQLQAQQGNEASRQFGAQQALTNAQQAAQYGQSAQAQNMQQQQFGANFGLQGLQGQLNAAQAQGSLGVQQNAAGIANLNAQLGAGATERGIEQEGIGALKAQFEEERQDPFKKVQFAQSLYSGLPTSTVTASTATSPIQRLNALGSGVGSVYDSINRFLPT
jgi:hypothetical protein